MQQRLLPVASVTLISCLGLLLAGGSAYAGTTAPVLPPTVIAGSTAPVPTSAGLASRLNPLLTSPSLGDAAAIVLDPATGETLFDRASATPHVPASTTKLLTAAAALHVLVPAWVYEHLAGQIVLGIAVMAVLAVVLALCSEADAFVAASLSMLPLLPRLVFLVVGPAIDIKLFAMQAGMFGRAFAIRFAPVTFAVAVLAGTGVGMLVLGLR